MLADNALIVTDISFDHSQSACFLQATDGSFSIDMMNGAGSDGAISNSQTVKGVFCQPNDLAALGFGPNNPQQKRDIVPHITKRQFSAGFIQVEFFGTNDNYTTIVALNDEFTQTSMFILFSPSTSPSLTLPSKSKTNPLQIIP